MWTSIVCSTLLLYFLACSRECQSQSDGTTKPIRCCSARPLVKKFGPGPNGKPVTVDVGQCVGPCTSGLTYWNSGPVGGADQFTGVQASSPSSLFLASSYLAGRPLNLFFDKFGVNRFFGHTLRLPFNCRDILRIKFKFCANASSNSLTFTDHVAIWDPQPGSDQPLWSPRLTTLFGQWNPRDNGCYERSFTAGDLTGIFDYVSTFKELNVGLDDDSGMDYIQLEVWYDRTAKVCKPSKKTKVKVALATGVRTVEKIVDCDCIPSNPGRCTRKPKPKLEIFFHNSIYEQVIDVGQCTGACLDISLPWLPADKVYDVVLQVADPGNSSRKIDQILLAPQRDLKCQPYRTKEVTIRGPNGPICVEAIAECRCNDNCYKMAHFEEFVEVIKLDNQLTAERRRLFNIGKCAGSCDDSAAGGDVMYLDDDCPRKCVPTGYINHKPFLLRDGTFKTVAEIRDCDCSQVGK